MLFEFILFVIITS